MTKRLPDGTIVRVALVSLYAAARAGLRSILSESSRVAVTLEVTHLSDLNYYSDPIDVIVADANNSRADDLVALAAKKEAGLVIVGGQPEFITGRDLRGFSWLQGEAEPERIVVATLGAAVGMWVVERELACRIGGSSTPAVFRSSSESMHDLSSREREVLQLMTEGLSNKEIASQLFVTSHTVKFHVASILSKLNATSRTEAVMIGIRSGITAL